MQARLKNYFAWICLSLALLALAIPLYQALAVPAPVELQSVHAASEIHPLYGFAPDSFLNTADAAALDALPGVGEVIAQRIVEMREALGGFQLPEDLLLVHGIGEKVSEKIMDALDENLVELKSTAVPQQIFIK